MRMNREEGIKEYVDNNIDFYYTSEYSFKEAIEDEKDNLYSIADGSSLETLCKGVCDDCVLKYMCLTTKDDYINIGAIDIVRWMIQ
jgi:hypothetical protein